MFGGGFGRGRIPKSSNNESNNVDADMNNDAPGYSSNFGANSGSNFNDGGRAFGSSNDGGADRPRRGGCFNCGEDGHMSRECPKPRKERSGGGNFGSTSAFSSNNGGGGFGSGGGGAGGFGSDGGGFGSGGGFGGDSSSGGGFGDGSLRQFGGGSGGGGFGSSNGDGGDRKPRGCFNCGDTGHMSRECPKPRDESRRGSGRGDRGGRGRGQFENNRSAGFGSSTGFESSSGGFGDSNSGGFGGKSDSGFGQGGSGDRPRKGCFNCGEDGHMSRDCPAPRKERGGGGGGNFGSGGGGFGSSGGGGGGDGGFGGGGGFGDSSTGGGFGSGGGFGMSNGDAGGERKPRGCYNCGETGHMSRDCTNPKDDSRRGRSDRGGRGRGGYGNDNAGSGFGASADGGSGGFGFGSSSDGFGDKSGGGFGGSESTGGGFGEARNAGFGGDSGSRTRKCFNCEATDHMSKDCPQPRNARPGDGEDGGRKAPVDYVPKEKTVEELGITERIATGINFEKYNEVNVDVTGTSISYRPLNTFAEAGITETILKNIGELNWNKPTPIQKHAIPLVLAGSDIMACAQTGSGKTGAFLLPILTKMIRKDDLNTEVCEAQEPNAIVISPTRELAIQIFEEAMIFSKGTKVRPAIIYGGTNVRVQCDRISKGCNVLVATPGRLKQFINEGRISLKKCGFFVLDEADRMLDMGFLPDVRLIATHPTMPSVEQRQTLMFSATFPREIQELAAEFLRSGHAFIAVGIVGAANSDIKQVILKLDTYEKKDKLVDMLQADIENCQPNAEGKYSKKTLVFVERKRTADFIASFLSQKKVLATSIQGDRQQSQREEALYDFKSGRCPVLVATDVAARGLDIVGVDHVINYDLPKRIDDYVHRIGRTGRVGNIGRATSFYDVKSDSAMASDLVKILSDAQQEIPEFLQSATMYIGNSGVGSNSYGSGMQKNDGWD